MQRLKLWALCVLIALDQLAHCLLGGPKYILFGGPTPDPDETISSIVGRQAIVGKRWALICEVFIDALFGAGHCRSKIGT
ncbi:hypothetical protein D3Y57_19285 [Sphingomonas paeninsulae]|uniref:Uncharacterized protein n=1 Tax=Sphingomonas paeninsulae TaxID=2319844 RepID=A0A494TF24_SPHPE|nr:hypothetical protein D3Y57_19285 [Sphingomonas paeninsulae]